MNLRGFGPPTLINRSLKLNMLRQGLSDSSFENYEPTEKNWKMPHKNIFVSVNGPNFWKFHIDQISSEDFENFSFTNLTCENL